VSNNYPKHHIFFNPISFGKSVAALDPALVDEIRLAINGGFVLGYQRFQAEIAGVLGRRVTRGHPGRQTEQGAP
jgi:hypothetical protein